MPKPIQHEIHSRWTLRFIVVFAVSLAYLATYNQLNQLWWNSQYIKLGKSIDCRNRLNPLALKCDPMVDGVSCEHGSRSRVRDWYAPIDYACAQYEPERSFVFPVYSRPEGQEVAEAG